MNKVYYAVQKVEMPEFLKHRGPMYTVEKREVLARCNDPGTAALIVEALKEDKK